MEYMPYIWLGLIVFLLILEAVTVQLVSIWFVLGAVAAFIVSLIAPANLALQLALFFVLSVVILIFARPFVERFFFHQKKECTNADRVIGQTAIVTEDINNGVGTGLVNVSGQIWSARTADQSVVTKGATVQILSIQGVKLIVVPVQPAE